MSNYLVIIIQTAQSIVILWILWTNVNIVNVVIY